jgi:hypothetical protein
MIDDTYALLKWLEDLYLKAHNHAENSVTEYGKQAYTKEKEAYNRVINYIKTMGKKV